MLIPNPRKTRYLLWFQGNTQVLLEICWPVGIVYGPIHQAEGPNMKNPLDSITGTIVSGVVITIILYVFVSGFLV